MTDDGEPREDASPAEAGLRRHLGTLREDAPDPDRSLTEKVVRRARWQRAIRGPLRAAGVLAAAVADGIRGAVGARRSR